MGVSEEAARSVVKVVRMQQVLYTHMIARSFLHGPAWPYSRSSGYLKAAFTAV